MSYVLDFMVSVDKSNRPQNYVDGKPLDGVSPREVADLKHWTVLMVKHRYNGSSPTFTLANRPIQHPTVDVEDLPDDGSVTRDIFNAVAKSVQYKHPVWAQSIGANLADYLDLNDRTNA